MSCTICQHPKHREIDQALIAGSATLADLGQQYNLSTSALHRHQAHLQAKVTQAKDRLQDNLRQGCLFWLSRALEMSMQTAQTAQADGNSKVVLQAIRQGTRLIGIILKQDFQLDHRVVYEILASPQWTAQDSLLPHDPHVLVASRQSLAEALSTPCPDTAAAPPPPTENRKLETENRLVKQREKRGKLPGKYPFQEDNNKKYQQDKLNEKIAGSLDLLQPNHIASLETRNQKLETLFQSDDLSLDLLQQISHNLAELQSLQAEAEDGLRQTGNGK